MNKHAIFNKYCKYYEEITVNDKGSCAYPDEIIVIEPNGNSRKCLQQNCPYPKEIKKVKIK